MVERQSTSTTAVFRGPILLILLGLLAWGAWVATGVVLGEYGRQDTSPSNRIALYKGLLVATSILLFALLWSLALVFRSRRLRAPKPKPGKRRKRKYKGLDLDDKSEDPAD